MARPLPGGRRSRTIWQKNSSRNSICRRRKVFPPWNDIGRRAERRAGRSLAFQQIPFARRWPPVPPAPATARPSTSALSELDRSLLPWRKIPRNSKPRIRCQTSSPTSMPVLVREWSFSGSTPALLPLVARAKLKFCSLESLKRATPSARQFLAAPRLDLGPSDPRVPLVAAVLPEAAAAAPEAGEAVDRLDRASRTWPSCSRAGARPGAAAARRGRPSSGASFIP